LYDLGKLKEIFGKNSNSSQEIDDLTNIIKNLVAASKEVEERLKVVKKEKEELLKQLEALEKVEVELEVDQQELLSNLEKYDNTTEEINTDIDENEQIFNTFYETKNSLFELKTSLEKEYNNYLQTWRRSGNNSKKPSEERPEILDSFDFKEFLDKITLPENLLKLINKYKKEEIDTNSNNTENDVFDEVDLEQLIQEVDEDDIDDIDDFDFDDLD
jgi:chromosome segregation ATPase